MSEKDKSPIIGRRTINGSVHNNHLPGEVHIVSRRKVNFSETQSNETITLADKLPEELQIVIGEIRSDAPIVWREQAIQTAYFIWSLDSGKQLNNRNGQSLQEERQRFVDQLSSTGFVRRVYNRPARWALDPSKSLPSWLSKKNSVQTGQLNEVELQRVKSFYDSYAAAHATLHISPDGQKYADYTDGVLPKEIATFAGSHRSKGYVEGLQLRDIYKLEQVLLQLREQNVHPHTTKLFDGDRLVLYWDNRLTAEQKLLVENAFSSSNIKLRAFAQDVPEVELTKDGYRVVVRASNDGSLGEGGHNPFDWEETNYNAEAFLKRYLQLTYWACKSPNEPYQLSFIPIITGENPNQEQVAEIQEKIKQTDKLPSLLSESSYLNCMRA